MPIINDGKARRTGENALSTIMLLIKNGFVQKVLKTGSLTEYKTLTDNNLSDELKSKYDAAYTHSQSNHAPSDAQSNVIESIKVNNVDQAVEGKAVNIAVPELSTNINTDRTLNSKAATPKAVYEYVATAIASMSGGLSFKILTDGEYDPESRLPTIEGSPNFFYLVPIAGSTNNVYTEYIFVEDKYEPIGTTEVDLSGYMKVDDLVEFTTEEINALWTSVFGS